MAYRMTAKRKAALRKAQLVSARKRRKGGKKRKRMDRTRRQLVGVGFGLAGAAAVASAYAGNRRIGGRFERYTPRTQPTKLYTPGRFAVGVTSRGEGFAGVRVRGKYSNIKYSTRNTRRNPFFA